MDGGHLKNGPKGAVASGMAQPVEVRAEERSAAMDSEETISGDDVLSFELKRREDSAVQSKQSQAGRVRRVVKALETGLVMNDESPRRWIRKSRSPEPTLARVDEEGLLGINAYGTNLLDPSIGGLKRPLEGDIAGSPVPKKQFVEDDDSLDKVEEASLEWPQSDK
ncbi:unnamed protein product [Linum trigynum]|uniref:Uncharacterized protein n=1 Tax=Linum trigynum TaxID=586398 RepID=A0AAV2FPX3_9ROSI